ncbi:unnamed protein product [Dicrocoelium dendriticum]|nr:unnamed protein product [Dicrocoelium dendriticum]
METDYFQPVLGAAINPNVRCLVGLYGSQRDDGLDDAFSAILEDDTADEPDLLSYVLNVDDTDRVRFLIGSQSLRPNGSQITLVTLFEPDDSRPVHLVKQTFSHPDGEVIGLTAIAAQPNWFVSTYSTYSTERPELRTGARIWRLPGLTDDGNPSDHETFVELTESPSNGLEYVTTLPLDKYSGIRKIVAHPSGKCADLACIVGPPTDSIE